jgi:hypothetical protein
MQRQQKVSNKNGSRRRGNNEIPTTSTTTTTTTFQTTLFTAVRLNNAGVSHMMVPNGHQDSVAVESFRESLRIDQTMIRSMMTNGHDNDIFRKPNSFLSMFGDIKMHLALTLPKNSNGRARKSRGSGKRKATIASSSSSSSSSSSDAFVFEKALMIRDDKLSPQQQQKVDGATNAHHINVAIRTMSAVSTFNIALMYHRKASSMMASVTVHQQEARHMLEKAKSMYIHALDVAVPMTTRASTTESSLNITSGGSTLLLVVLTATNNLAALLRKYGIDDRRSASSSSSKLQQRRIPQPRPSHSAQRIIPVLRKTLHLLSLSSIQRASLHDLVTIDEWNGILMNVCQAYLKLTSKQESPSITPSSSASSVSACISPRTSSRRTINGSPPTPASIASLSSLAARINYNITSPPPVPAGGLSQQQITALIVLLLQQQRQCAINGEAAVAAASPTSTTIADEREEEKLSKKK